MGFKRIMMLFGILVALCQVQAQEHFEPRTLVVSQAIAIKKLVDNMVIEDCLQLIKETVELDDHLLYAVITAEGPMLQIICYSSEKGMIGIFPIEKPAIPETDEWAKGIHKFDSMAYTKDGKKVTEYAQPIFNDTGEIISVVRYGFLTGK